jgi:hypothetical protein
MALAGTRGIADAVVAAAASATAIKPSLMNLFIGFPPPHNRGKCHKFPSRYLFQILTSATPRLNVIDCARSSELPFSGSSGVARESRFSWSG